MTFGARVALAVSAFRSDDAVLRVLDSACASGAHPFHQVLVVDSLPTGRLEDAIAARGYARVAYRAFDRNLGSAGNLMERLRAAAEGGADFVYALNHDGVLDLAVVEALVRFARTRPRIGAVYPARRYVNRGGTLDLAGARGDVLGTLVGGRRDAPRGPIGVRWSSSNGALYALEPVRRGLLPWGELFMGYEDLEYGWTLERGGYEQHLLGDVRVDDGYEYRAHRLGPLRFHVSDKPAWYAYYFARNLVLVARKHRRGRVGVGARIGVELGLVATLRRDKATRLRYLARGVLDGLRDVRGKWDLP